MLQFRKPGWIYNSNKQQTNIILRRIEFEVYGHATCVILADKSKLGVIYCRMTCKQKVYRHRHIDKIIKCETQAQYENLCKILMLYKLQTRWC